MPRKSAAAIALFDPRGQRLEPPPDLSEAERAAFVAAVKSVKPGHFVAEDVSLLTAYASTTVQERAIGRKPTRTYLKLLKGNPGKRAIRPTVERPGKGNDKGKVEGRCTCVKDIAARQKCG